MHAQDRPLLIGLIALEQEFVSAAELIDAFRSWRERPGESITEILASRANLSDDRLKSLHALVANSALDQPSEQETPGEGRTTTARLHSPSAVPFSRPHVPPLSDGERNPGIAAASETVRYKPIRLHARGGLGQVFLAEDLELHRQVALKEILPDMAEESISHQRFVAEAQITGNLEHPGIVPVYGLGAHADGRPFYAMRFIQGQTLAEAIKKFHASPRADFKSLDFRQLLGRMISVCNAVAFAHSRDIVHRDLKPQNVMLGPFGETLVVDWGLAKPFQANESVATVDWRPQWPSSRIPAERESVTAAGEVVGTPAYMSPEQAAGTAAAIGPLSDVYSLGGVLYALLSGHSPKSSEATDILEAVRQGKLDPPRKINPHAPAALAAICAKAMAHEAQQRYSSALELAADLERWLADERVAAYSEPWTDTAFRWTRKHRLPVAVASMILLVSSIALSVGYGIVSKQRDIAEAARRDAVAANERAQENAAATRQVIEQYLIRIGDDRWSNVPGFEGVRIEMANLAVERYRDLLKQQPKDASLAADAGMALRRSANLYRMVGQNDTSAAMYDESVSRFEQALDLSKRAAKHEQSLCETLCDRALLIARVNGSQAAIGPMRETLEFAKQMRSRQPTSISAGQVVARIEGDLADLLRDVGQYEEAIRLSRSSAQTLQAAADRNSRSLSNRLTAALSGVNLGAVLREAGRGADAEQSLNRALARTNEYLGTTPNDVNLRFIYGRCQHELALVHAADGQLEPTQAEIREAAATLSKLVEDFPLAISYRRKLAHILSDSAEIDLRRAATEPAAESARRSIELFEELDASQSSGGIQKLLAAALVVAAEIELKRNDLKAARGYAARAGASIEQARTFNSQSPQLVDLQKRLETLAAALDP